MLKRALVVSLILAHATGSAVGQEVSVKYRDTFVNLKHFSCTRTASSFLHEVCYDKKNQYLVMLLNTTRYHWCSVDEGTVNSLLAADSKGRYFNANIKGRFDCRLGRVPIY